MHRFHIVVNEDALDSLRDVIRIYVEDGLGDDEAPPQHDELSFTSLRG